jgi:hypothetical protein
MGNLMICESSAPSLEQVKAALESASHRYVSFSYTPQLPPKALTPSVIAQWEDTRQLGPLDLAKGFLEAKDATATAVWETKAGHVCCIIKSMMRRKALPTGEGYFARYGMDQGEYLWRSYRLEGIGLATVMVADGSNGLVRLFPCVPAI